MRLTSVGLIALLLLGAAAPAAQAQKHSPAVTRDADHDGVPDMRDRCPGTPAGFVVNTAGCPTGVFIQPALPALETQTAAAAPPAPPVRAGVQRTRVGLGAAVGGSQGSILVPILLESGLSIEPSVGLSRSTSELSGFGSTTTFTTTGLLLGISVGIPVVQTESARFYVAPRFGIVKIWAKTEDGSSIIRRGPVDWTAGMGVGGEVFVTPRASAGGELGVSYLRTNDDESGGGFTSKGSLLSVGGRLAVRWYFGGR